jgi:hypothetical protein
MNSAIGNATMREPDGGFTNPGLAKLFDGLAANRVKINHASRDEMHMDFMRWALLGFWLIQLLKLRQ